MSQDVITETGYRSMAWQPICTDTIKMMIMIQPLNRECSSDHWDVYWDLGCESNETSERRETHMSDMRWWVKQSKASHLLREHGRQR